MDNSFPNLLFEITLDETWKFILVAAGFSRTLEIKKDDFQLLLRPPNRQL